MDVSTCRRVRMHTHTHTPQTHAHTHIHTHTHTPHTPHTHTPHTPHTHTHTHAHTHTHTHNTHTHAHTHAHTHRNAHTTHVQMQDHARMQGCITSDTFHSVCPTELPSLCPAGAPWRWCTRAYHACSTESPTQHAVGWAAGTPFTANQNSTTILMCIVTHSTVRVQH